MQATVTKQIADARHALQRAIDEGNSEKADRLMIEVKALQAQTDAPPITKAHPVSVPAARPGAKVPPAVERSAPLWRMLTVRTIAAIEGKPVSDVLAQRYPELARKDGDAVMTGIRAAQNPAMTTVAGWAQELTREAYGAFLGELARVSALAALPLADESFGGATSITVPTRDTTSANPNLAATWRKEGDPIRVGAVKLRGVRMTPTSPAVIGTFTMELLRRSTPSIERIIREAILLDSATAFDTKFLSSDAEVVGVSPAGVLSGLPAANTYASTGATPAQIVADLKKALGLLLRAGLAPGNFCWLMSHFNAASLQLLITATGALQFPTMESGLLLGARVVVSQNVPDADVFLIDCASVARSLTAPEFDVSTEATIHEEDTDPLPIIAQNEVPAAVPSSPVRSLYQTFSGAVRATYNGLAWAPLRSGAVVHVTDVAW